MSCTDLVELIEAKVLSAIEAEEAGDIPRALQLMEQAEMAMSAIPDGSREEESFEFDRESIRNSIANLKRKRAAAAGTQTFGVKYVRG